MSVLQNVFFLSILFIFASALVAAFLSSRNRDKCLADLHGFQVTVEHKDGDLVWGRLRVYSSGIELEYPSPHLDREGHLETSYILYSNEFQNIQAIYRYPTELTDELRLRRERDLERTHQPSPFRRLGRRLRNLVNIFRDALMQSVGLVIGQVKRAAPGSMVLKTQEARIAAVGKTIVGHAGNAFDPILEKYIGEKVVLEITGGGTTREFPGILKEYTAHFLEVTGTERGPELRVTLRPSEGRMVSRSISLTTEGKRVSIENRGVVPIYAKRVEGKDYSQRLGVAVEQGSVTDFEIDDPNAEDLRLVLETTGEVDVVVPRTHSLIRHGGETGRASGNPDLAQS